MWVFINNRLAVDRGGIQPPLEATLNVDSAANSLGMVDGRTYTMDIFYAERGPANSCIKMSTTLDIFASDSSTPVQSRHPPSVLRAHAKPRLLIPFQTAPDAETYFSLSGRKYRTRKLSMQPLIEIQHK
ncbi:MAG: fibro-slime domain-containing protein [Chitinispirillaceae bacterium]|nr:fibro-slime domain-containing protein [Chitinispirillaceae bacterium]